MAPRHIDLDGLKPPVLSAQPPPRPFDFNRADYLFPDFMRDKDRYDHAQIYWEIVFNRARNAAPVPEEEQWRLHWHYNPVRNGDSIFSAVCRPRKLAVRVNQKPPLTGGEFAWCVEIIKEGRRGLISELIITCVPCRNTMKRVFPLLISWLRGDTLPQEFEAKYDV